MCSCNGLFAAGLFGADITIFSRWGRGRAGGLVCTRLQGVSWYGHNGVGLGDAGPVAADRYVVRVPQGALAGYLPPDEWAALDAPPPAGSWTVRCGDVVVLGLAGHEAGGDDPGPGPGGLAAVMEKHRRRFVVTAVADNRGPALGHLCIKGGA